MIRERLDLHNNPEAHRPWVEVSARLQAQGLPSSPNTLRQMNRVLLRRLRTALLDDPLIRDWLNTQ